MSDDQPDVVVELEAFMNDTYTGDDVFLAGRARDEIGALQRTWRCISAWRSKR